MNTEARLELSRILLGDFSDGSAAQVLPELLRAARLHLGMEIAFISEFKEGYRIFRYVDEQHGGQMLQVEAADPLEEGYCQRVVDGRLPALIHNAQELSASRDLAVTSALQIAAHLSVPIKLSTGETYGTFCCFSSEPDYSLTPRDLALMETFAEIAGAVISKDVQAARLCDERRKRVKGVLDGNGLAISWQPITDIKKGEIVGVEALSRFTVAPIRSPDVWFAEARSVGLSPLLEARAMEMALEALDNVPPDVYVACNVSVEALLSNEILDLLPRYPLHRVVLELTEHDEVNDYLQLAEVLRPFREAGLRVAVDDAGAGYSSFSHILRVQPDLIKLDMSLTRDIDTDIARAALAEALVRFAVSTGCGLIAEGVEKGSELDALRSIGVNSVQGYFLHRPMGSEELKQLLFRQA